LQQRAAAVAPVGLEFQDHLLEREHRLEARGSDPRDLPRARKTLILRDIAAQPQGASPTRSRELLQIGL
jgi:hypothetical protein